MQSHISDQQREENASMEYSGIAIKNLIEEVKLSRCTFTFTGTDHDVKKFAASISITNIMFFSKNDTDMKAMFAKEKSLRHNYSQNIRENKNTEVGFYNYKSGKRI